MVKQPLEEKRRKWSFSNGPDLVMIKNVGCEKANMKGVKDAFDQKMGYLLGSYCQEQIY